MKRIAKEKSNRAYDRKSNKEKKKINFVLIGKFMIIHLIPGLVKKISLYKSSFSTESSSHCENKIKFELDLLLKKQYIIN